MTDDRLHEIAAREYGPNRQEGIAMAKELLALRTAVRALAGYAGDFAVDYPAIAEGIASAAAAAGPARWSPAIGDVVEDVRCSREGTIVRQQPGPLPWVVRRPDGTETGYAAHEIRRPTRNRRA